MQLQSALFALLTLGAAVPTAYAAIYNEHLKVRDIGHVDTKKHKGGPHRILPVDVAGPCGGIPEGGHVCGSYEDEGVDALRAVYTCNEGVLMLRETCFEKQKENRCVKNGRLRGKRFFPFVPVERVVCVKKSAAEKP